MSSSAVGKQAKCAKCGQRFAVAELKPPTAAGAAKLAQASAAAPAKPAKEHTKSAPAPSPTVKTKPAPTAAPSKAAPAATKTRGRLTQQELLAAFREPFPRARPRITYRVGILLISLTMVVLPLVYLAFIALVGFGVYYHAVNHTWLLEMGRGRSRAFVALVYAAPLVAGPIAVFFMFKPLLARPSRLERYRSLRRESEPLLFAFIDRICDEVGAPRPKRIDVDCTINAGAGFRRGLLSMFGRDLVLVIGLGLTAGLTMREFAGVMAHELGHFSQGLGMRLSYLVESIVDWFIRVVYQRDQWDDWLDETAEELDFRIGWIFLVAKLFVMIGRGILWVLFHIGLTISGIMLRQMEFDADRYLCRFAGSAAVGSFLRKAHLLAGASQIAQMQLSASLDLRKLVDNYPGLIAYHAKKWQGRRCRTSKKRSTNRRLAGSTVIRPTRIGSKPRKSWPARVSSTATGLPPTCSPISIHNPQPQLGICTSVILDQRFRELRYSPFLSSWRRKTSVPRYDDRHARSQVVDTSAT